MAASDTTRMLVLGAAHIFEPANGYQLRRELLSWGIESWANINPGSIYSMLTTLAKTGSLLRTDIVPAEGSRAVAVYTVTDDGKAELLRLVRDGLVTVDAFGHARFYAALSLMVTFLSRDQVLELLAQRRQNLLASIEKYTDAMRSIAATKSAPPHVAPLIGFAVAIPTAELGWLDAFLHSIQAGELVFAGESGMEQWEPLPDDPAWRMVDERATYLKQLRASVQRD